MNDEEKIKRIEETLKNGKKLTSVEAWALMRNATEKNEKLVMLWKIPNEKYAKWYEKNKQYLNTTIEDETTYIVHSGAKAFNSGMGGYSIFAVSVGMLKRNDNTQVDRIEHMTCEWAIIIDL